MRRYAVILEQIKEPGLDGFYYAHIPAVGVTTHGQGIEAALRAARELTEACIAEKRANGEAIPEENATLFAQVEVGDAIGP